jgi:cell division protein FtsQ
MSIALAVILVCMAAGAGARIWLTTSRQFAVEHVALRGNRALDETAVREAMGIAGGENIFGLDMGDLERALRDNPWIREARVERRLPDRLQVELVERLPVAIAELGGLYLVDAEGCAFKRAAIERGEGDGLPVITGISRAAYTADTAAACARIRAALDGLALYTGTGQRPAIGEVHIEDQGGLTLYTRDAAMATRLGTGSRLQLLARLGAFDAAWGALSPDERRAAQVVHVNRDTTPQRVSVAFAHVR